MPFARPHVTVGVGGDVHHFLSLSANLHGITISNLASRH